MKLRTLLLELARWLAVLLAVVFLGMSLRQEPVSRASFAEVQGAVTQSFDQSNTKEADARMVRRLYSLNPSELEGCLLCYPVTNMEAEELLLVKVAEETQVQTVTDAIKARLETQKASFDGYGLEQYDLLTRHAVIESRGGYVLFVVCENAELVRQAFLDAL